MRSSLSRLRSSKKATNINTDVDFDDAIDSFKRRGRVDFSDGFDSRASSDRAAGSSIKKSSFKVFKHNLWTEQIECSDSYCKKIKNQYFQLTSRREEESEPIAITKWTAVKSVDESNTSAASARAKATKARLNDLESEMYERSEKQLAREKRSQQLKQFLVDSDIETVKASF